MREIIDQVESLGGLLTLRPVEGDGSPEIAWGDVFFYYAPDGVVPPGQPFATIVTKDYPDDTSSRLDRPGAFRVNVNARGAQVPVGGDPAEEDALIAHPVYGRMGWVAVVNPGERTMPRLTALLTEAHAEARQRYEKRQAGDGQR